MLRLMLLRHAKSDWSVAGAADHDRTLNARGRAAATLMGQYIARERLLPSAILCSSAERTRETCDRVTKEFSRTVPVHFERRLYEASPDRIIELISGTPNDETALMVIGHNPGMQLAALSLITEGNTKMRAKLAEKFPTAALAIIDFAISDWGGVPAGGRLERFVIPREIAQAD